MRAWGGRAAGEAALGEGREALGRGRLGAAERAFRRARDAARRDHTREGRRRAAEATFGLAYVTAFRKDYRAARRLFAAARRACPPEEAKPKAKREPQLQPEAPLNEQAAYQEAVCVSASEGREAGIKAFEDFIERYPYSSLIHGAVLRIRRLNGDRPTERCERVWKRARALQEAKERRERAAASRCGPECLADVLAHYGVQVGVDELAEDAGTDETGTSLDGLARAARKHGLSAVGLKVTEESLREQPLPSIALVGGHYVLLTEVSSWGVTIVDRGGEQRISWRKWNQRWAGVLLRLQPRKGAGGR